jgi:periplasmic protein TonB
MPAPTTRPRPEAGAGFQPSADGLGPGTVRTVVVGILALHGLAGWALLQVEAVRQALVEAAPVFVHLVDAPAPPPSPPSPPSPRVLPKPAPSPPAPVLRAAPAPTQPSFTVPPPPPVIEPLAPAAPAAPPEAVAAAPAPPAPVPAPVLVSVPAPVSEPVAAPRQIPASAVQYLEAPAPVYPRASIRLNESGVVVVRVLIGADGLPAEVQVATSSGHPRLDEAAVAGVRRARFRPPTENGLPIPGWARIPIPFELER